MHVGLFEWTLRYHDIIKAITKVVARLQKNLRLSASEDACRLSGNVITTTHPVNIFTLTDVSLAIARFLQNRNQRIHLSFIT